MGWRFSLKDANIVSYLTSAKKNGKTPRIDGKQLIQFLIAIQDAAANDKSRVFITSDPNWKGEIAQAAGEAITKLQIVFQQRNYYSSKSDNPNEEGELTNKLIVAFLNQQEEFVEPKALNESLHQLKRLFSKYQFFGLFVGNHDPEADAFADYVAYNSKSRALFLIPEDDNNTEIRLLDPFPGVSLLANEIGNFPGILFWVRTGKAAFAPLSEGKAERLYRQLMESENDRDFESTLDDYSPPNQSKKILHLSDLHFGTSYALDNKTYLKAHLKQQANEMSRIVITGDLFDNPKGTDAVAFNDFRNDLKGYVGKDVIVIPGNHDQKVMGNNFYSFGTNLHQLANLNWSDLVIDDEMSCVFFCFDSTRHANFAKGIVTKKQRQEVATQFETECGINKKVKDYLRIALIHHHPFSFEATNETFIQKVLGKFGLTDESFLKMDEAEEFLTWCAKRNVPLILHGHKHLQRHVSKNIEVSDYNYRKVTSIGCGTSLGAEGKPLTYNVLSWNDTSKNWGASFYEDIGDGSGFEIRNVVLHTE